MSDVVVTVPKGRWAEWLAEGQLAGEPWDGLTQSHFWIRRPTPNIAPGERVYIVAHNRLRGYSPLVRVEERCWLDPGRACLLRHGQAVALTIPESIQGFQGYRYRWWSRLEEVAFPGWMEADGE